ncbi:MAG: polyprenyl synthetase family protein [Anaerolineales bacterium]|nr:MAG: polyprenyl synthetase family protein [Anaerolineales bacterium]
MSFDPQPYLDAIEAELRSILCAPNEAVAPLYDMMAYHLGWLDHRFRPAVAAHGKRVRPLLCLLSCEASGGDWRHALPAAAALELVHNFSLIHDDIEDNSPIRRGRPTVWNVWGLAHGINVGDTMLVVARQALARLSELSIPSSTVLAAMDILDHTLAALCQGQYLDIAYEGQLGVKEEAYLEMIGAKTAALLAASTQLGALVGGAGDQIAQYREFGWQLGMAFQMVDDILGIWGDPDSTGKPAASDIRSRKMTLPVIFALGASDVRQQLVALYERDNLTDDHISQAVGLLERVGAREYAQQRAAQYEAGALEALSAVTARSPADQYLRSLAASVVSRER